MIAAALCDLIEDRAYLCDMHLVGVRAVSVFCFRGKTPGHKRSGAWFQLRRQRLVFRGKCAYMVDWQEVDMEELVDTILACVGDNTVCDECEIKDKTKPHLGIMKTDDDIRI